MLGQHFHRITKVTKTSIGIKTVQICFLLFLLLITFQIGFIKASGGTECFTGDGPIMRRKSCPVADFSDMCFKKVGENGRGETMRGCFNSVIASLMVKNNNDRLKEGCYPIPDGLGAGTLCVCDTNLCNSAKSLKMGALPSTLSLSSIVRYFTSNKLYFGLLVLTVMYERIPLI